MANHISKLLLKALNDYGIKMTYNTIAQTILTHPAYPSMQCISDALDGWKIKNVVMELTTEQLRALNVPVIAHLNKGVFIWITQVTDTQVHYWSVTEKQKTKSIELFEKEWSGVALAIVNIDDAGEPDYKTARNREIKDKLFKTLIISAFILLLTLLTCLSLFNDSSLSLPSKLLLLFSNALGCYVSYRLIRQEKRRAGAKPDKFCQAGKYIDCKKVTDSKYSTFFGVVSLAELGAAFFSTMFLWVAIAPLSDGWLPPLWWFSLLVLPFTLWSLTMQAFVIRKWCLYCCSVVFLLWVNAVVLFLSCPVPAILSIAEAAMFALLFLSCLVAVIVTTKATGTKASVYALQRETAQYKYNIENIQSQLSETTETIEDTGFTFGNAESLFEIGLFVSFSCTHCREAIKALHKLTDIYPHFSYRLLFAVDSTDSDDKAYRITKCLFNLYNDQNGHDFFKALDTLYSKSDNEAEDFLKTFPATPINDYKAEIESLYLFTQQVKTGYTPAILLDGRLLSQLYAYNDLYGIARAFNAKD